MPLRRKRRPAVRAGGGGRAVGLGRGRAEVEERDATDRLSVHGRPGRQHTGVRVDGVVRECEHGRARLQAEAAGVLDHAAIEVADDRERRLQLAAAGSEHTGSDGGRGRSRRCAAPAAGATGAMTPIEGDVAAGEVLFLSDAHGSAAYKKELLRVYLSRAIREATS